MIAASIARQRPPGAKLLVLDECGRLHHAPRSALVDFLRSGDLVVANDAATLPASLAGMHEPTGAAIEVRLAARRGPGADDVCCFSAVVFGAGDFHTRTEHRALPPPLAVGDSLRLGPLMATIQATLGHPRLVALKFAAPASVVWEGLARHGRPIQYAHMPAPLALWDVWTPIAGPPVAFEPPSAGFALDWATLAAMKRKQVAFATLTLASGISSTGDPALDARLPFDEPYLIPSCTARAVARARARGGRVIAIGTTVVRALEHAALAGGAVLAGAGIATQRIGRGTRLRVVDGILTGTHEPGASHYELLRAFAGEEVLSGVSAALEASGHLTHEFGDSLLVERQSAAVHCAGCRAAA
jgi:S-adenosylmethionine:tRNA ribosyltransferase-isomerase